MGGGAQCLQARAHVGHWRPVLLGQHRGTLYAGDGLRHRQSRRCRQLHPAQHLPAAPPRGPRRGHVGSQQQRAQQVVRNARRRVVQAQEQPRIDIGVVPAFVQRSEPPLDPGGRPLQVPLRARQAPPGWRRVPVMRLRRRQRRARPPLHSVRQRVRASRVPQQIHDGPPHRQQLQCQRCGVRSFRPGPPRPVGALPHGQSAAPQARLCRCQAGSRPAPGCRTAVRALQARGPLRPPRMHQGPPPPRAGTPLSPRIRPAAGATGGRAFYAPSPASPVTNSATAARSRSSSSRQPRTAARCDIARAAARASAAATIARASAISLPGSSRSRRIFWRRGQRATVSRVN